MWLLKMRRNYSERTKRYHNCGTHIVYNLFYPKTQQPHAATPYWIVLSCSIFKQLFIPLKPYRPETHYEWWPSIYISPAPLRDEPYESPRNTQTNRQPSETYGNSYAPLCNGRDGMYKSGAWRTSCIFVANKCCGDSLFWTLYNISSLLQTPCHIKARNLNKLMFSDQSLWEFLKEVSHAVKAL